jgi:hypothetical protein
VFKGISSLLAAVKHAVYALLAQLKQRNALPLPTLFAQNATRLSFPTAHFFQTVQ